MSDGRPSPNDGSTGVPACGCITPAELTVSKLSIKLNFKKSASDSIQLQAPVPVADGYSPTGERVGDVVKSFVLDEKRKAKTETEQVELSLEKSGGAVSAQSGKLSVKLAKGSFADALVDEGLTNTTVDDLPVSIDVGVDVGDVTLRKLVPQTSKSKQGSSGKTK